MPLHLMPRSPTRQAPPPALRRCAECSQPYTPFPVRESRLCAPCVYRAVTRWPDVPQRRRVLELAMRVGAPGTGSPVQQLLDAIEALPAVRRCALWLCADGTLRALHPTMGSRISPPPMDVLVHLHGCVFVRDLSPGDGTPPQSLRGWTLVAPLRAGARVLGVLAVAERRNARLVRLGDVELFATVAAALAAALERHRLLGETARLAEARHRLERLEALGALASETAHEIENALLAVHALLDSGDDGSSVGLRALCLRHLRQALDLSESLTALTAADASAPPAPVH